MSVITKSQGIVEQHSGGKIWCESAGEGHGCTFFIELPVTEAVMVDRGLQRENWQRGTVLLTQVRVRAPPLLWGDVPVPS